MIALESDKIEKVSAKGKIFVRNSFFNRNQLSSPFQGLTKSRRNNLLNFENFKALLDPRNQLRLKSMQFQTLGAANIITIEQSKTVRGIYLKRVYRDTNLISTMSIWKYKQLQESAPTEEGIPEKLRE